MQKISKLGKMKAFFPFLPLLLSCSLPAAAAEQNPVVGGAWTELRQGPVFDSPTVGLAKVWGPSLPLGNAFEVEKVYGRWLYGTPEADPRMSAKERAKAGWVYSRMLLLPGDRDSAAPAVVKKNRAAIYHAREAWKALGLSGDPIFHRIDFLESLVLSEHTLEAFARQDEAPLTRSFPELVPSAHAEEGKETGVGLTGTDLGFLDQEFHVLQVKKANDEKKRKARRAHAEKFPPLDDWSRSSALGRFMLRKYFEFPSFTHEELDGFIYMKATAARALRGCPKEIRSYWAGRPWNILRIFRLKSRPGDRHPWLQFKLPGGYFAVSGRAIDVAGNEAEMAFLLVRALVEETRVKRAAPAFAKKGWPKTLEAVSEEYWEKALSARSTKAGEALDVAHEISVDSIAIECISRAGYRPMAGLSYLRKLWAKKEEPWAKWFFENSPGIEYRLEKDSALLEASLSTNKFPEGKNSNIKRFATASRYWNMLP